MNAGAAVTTMGAGAHGTLASCVTESSGRVICTSISAGGIAGLGILVAVYLGIVVLGIVAAVKVVTKAGYSGWWVLIALVPLVGSIMALVFAFSKWPVLREVEMLRAQAAYGGPYGHGGGPGAWGTGFDGGFQPPGPFPPAAPGNPTSPSGHQPGGTGMAEQGPAQATLPTFGQVKPVTPDHGVGSGAGTPTAPSGAGPYEPVAHPPAGWFPTPDGHWRYWDGATWTDHYS